MAAFSLKIEMPDAIIMIAGLAVRSNIL